MTLTPPPTVLDDLSTARPVTVLGLGAMGRRVASRLVEHGVPVRVWNRTATTAGLPGAVTAASLGEAVTGAAAVLVCVRDDAASRAVWHAAAPSLRDDAWRVDLSTVSPAHARHLADLLGARFLEAPMVGSLPQVDAGQLRLLVGGDAGALDVLRPLLEMVAGRVDHVGPVGHAAVLKLAVNGLLATQLLVLGELLDVLRRSEVDLGAAAELLASLPVTSPALARSLPRVLAGDTTPAFPLELAAKDLRYLRAAAGSSQLLAVVGDAVDRAARHDGTRDVVALAMPAATSSTAS